MRQLWITTHRWIGLAMTGFLIVVGLTGSVLVFDGELHRRLDPDGP
jgi:uncharacterized iron-regulated membrane protein